MAKADAGGRQQLAFSGAISDYYWPVVIVLLSRAANRPDLGSRANRQAERGRLARHHCFLTLRKRPIRRSTIALPVWFRATHCTP